MLVLITSNLRRLSDDIGLQELLRSPLAKAYNITRSDIEDARDMLGGRVSGSKTADIPDRKLAIAMLLALTLAGTVGQFTKDRVMTLKPDDKKVVDFVEKSQKNSPIQAVKNFLKSLVQEEKAVRTEGKPITLDAAILDIAKKLGIKDPQWLKKVILFESRGEPGIKNPTSEARGLIQFLNSTARGLGYESSEDLIKKHPTDVGQLTGPVYEYLKKYGPFPTEQSLYMAVFYPKYRYEDPLKVFPRHVRRANPGIRTIKDYMDRVHGIPRRHASA